MAMRRRSVWDSPVFRFPEDPPRVRSLPQFLSVPNQIRPLIYYPLIPLPRMQIDSPSRFVLTLFCFLIRAGKPVEVFEAARVERMLRSGQSADAEHYLERFLPPIPIRDRSPLSILLRFHVRVFRIISKVAAGGPSGAKMAALFANPSEYISTYAPEPLQRWMKAH
ncbi:uncharacterized protein [Setaria viridis]|uniref:uncharacterized protein n=1 Tax=Setaria viridis TaxID=4556 RepID=UPI003B3B66AC